MSTKRGCCVYGCHNNTNKIKRWKTNTCETHKVKHEECDCRVPYVMLTFPTKDRDMLNEWIWRVNRKNWEPNYDTRICSEHFVDIDYKNKKTLPQYPVPFLKMGYQLLGHRSKAKRKPPPTRVTSPPKKARKEKIEQTLTSRSTQQSDSNSQTETRFDITCFENVVHSEPTSSDNLCKGCQKYKNKIRHLQGEVKYWQTLYFRRQKKPLSLDILHDDSKVRSYTGLPSRDVFDSLLSSFGGKVRKITRWHGPTLYTSNLQRKKFRLRTKSTQPFLRPKEEYFMALFQIKTMLKSEIVGDLFGVSSAVVPRTCLTWWKFMAKELKVLVYNPEEEAQRALLPPSFNTPQYRKAQHIIDCTEVFVETPKNKIAQASLWSNYKHHYTCKYLVSITPYGHINFISKGYGGCMSDRHIVEDSGFINEV